MRAVIKMMCHADRAPATVLLIDRFMLTSPTMEGTDLLIGTQRKIRGSLDSAGDEHV